MAMTSSPDLQRGRFPKLRRLEPVGIDAYDGDIRAGVAADDLSRKAVSVAQDHSDALSTLDDMVVGQMYPRSSRTTPVPTPLLGVGRLKNPTPTLSVTICTTEVCKYPDNVDRREAF